MVHQEIDKTNNQFSKILQINKLIIQMKNIKKFANKINIILLIITTFFLFNKESVFAIEYHVQKSESNEVKFISKAPIEDFEGVTSSIDGYLKTNKDDFSEGEVYFEVDLRKLNSGIGLRDRHMRENYLHTDKYPYATFAGKIYKSTKINENTIEVETNGKFKVHGIEKDTYIKATITTGANPNVKTSFFASLPDHNIEVPSLMFQKISDKMKVTVDFNLKLAK